MDIPYCLKDLTKIYFTCCGLLYGKEKQTLLIDVEPSEALRNPKWSGFFTKSFKGLLSKHKVQQLDLASRLWLALIRLLSADSIPLKVIPPRWSSIQNHL